MDWHARIRSAFGSTAPEASVVDELAQHAASLYDDLISSGCAPADAELRVGVLIARWVAEAPTLKHRSRRPAAVAPPPTRARILQGLAQDVWYALRLLHRQPRFAALVVLTMALGIGATTALFSVTYGVLLKPLPWVDADQLIVVKETRGGRPPRFGSFSNAAYLAWREQPTIIGDLAGWSPRTATLEGAGDPERIRATSVTPSMFRVLGVRALAGSLFTDRDDSAPVVVISESLWRTRFGGSDDAIGRGVQLDGDTYTIVGVLPDAAGYPDRSIRAWLPLRIKPATGNALMMFEAIARLRTGATPAQAADEGTSRGRFAEDTGLTTTAIFGGDGPVGVSASPLAESITGEVQRPLTILLGAVTLLLVIGVTNVTSLQLARASSRRRELAIRSSLGASPARVRRQLIVEHLVLGLVGGAAGTALAWWLERSAPSILPADFPRVTELTLSVPVVMFAAGVTAVTSLVSSLWLSARMGRLALVASLAEDGNAPVGASARSRVARVRFAIVTGQIALAGVLLTGALLLGRSFERLINADRGYDPGLVLSARISTPASRYTPARRSDLLGDMTERLAKLPGVEAAAMSTELPLTPGGSTSGFTMPARDGSGGTIQVQASPRIVSSGYFATLGMRVLAGRPLLSTDTSSSEPVVVVNDTFRKRYLGDAAIGARLPMALWGQNQSGDATVVGVVEDVRYIGAATPSLAEIYFSHRQLTVGIRPTTAALFVRTTTHSAALGTLVREVIAGSDRSIVPDGVMTLEDRLLASSLARPRLYAILLASFASIALVITGVGLFSALSYTVLQRTRELGVRAALGATGRDLIVLVLRQAVAVGLTGTAIALMVSWLVTRYLGSLLYGVSATDLVTYAAVPIVLFVVTVIACLAPAVRAAKLDPLKALRS